MKQFILGKIWAQEVLVHIEPYTNLQPIYTEFVFSFTKGSKMDCKSNSSSSGGSSNSSKPFIYFTQATVMESMAKPIFPDNENDPSCWNCRKEGHGFSRCHKYLNFTRIASMKSNTSPIRKTRRTEPSEFYSSLLNVLTSYSTVILIF